MATVLLWHAVIVYVFLGLTMCYVRLRYACTHHALRQLTYLQFVEGYRRAEGKVKQSVIASLGRLDKLGAR